MHTSFDFNEVQFIYFVKLLLVIVMSDLRNHFLTQGNKDSLLCFFINRMGFTFTFRLMIYFELTFVHGCEILYISSYRSTIEKTILSSLNFLGILLDN